MLIDILIFLSFEQVQYNHQKINSVLFLDSIVKLLFLNSKIIYCLKDMYKQKTRIDKVKFKRLYLALVNSCYFFLNYYLKVFDFVIAFVLVNSSFLVDTGFETVFV